MCIFSVHMYSLFGYYYHPLAEYLKGKTNIRKEKALPRGSSRRWVQEGGWPTRHQARQVSGSRLCAGRPCSSPPTPTAHRFNSPHPPYAKCTGIAHEEECPRVASPAPSGMSTLLTSVGWQASCSLESHLQPSGHPLSLHRWGADQADLHHSGTFLASVWFSYFCSIYVKCHSVLPKEIIVHLTLSSFEIINIWLVMCWSCQRHMSSCSKEPDTESSYAEDVVCLHAQVLVARAHHHHPQQQQRHRRALQCAL